MQNGHPFLYYYTMIIWTFVSMELFQTHIFFLQNEGENYVKVFLRVV